MQIFVMTRLLLLDKNKMARGYVLHALLNVRLGIGRLCTESVFGLCVQNQQLARHLLLRVLRKDLTRRLDSPANVLIGESLALYLTVFSRLG